MEKKKIRNITKKRIGWCLFFFFLFIIFPLFSNFIFQNWLLILLILLTLEGFFLGENLKDLIYPLLIMGGIFIVTLLIISWLGNIPLPIFKKTIDNNIMLVLLTALYVIFTIINVSTFKKHSERSRLPYLKLYILDDLDIKIIKESGKIARDIDITIRLKEIKEDSKFFRKRLDNLFKRSYSKKRLPILEKKESFLSTKEIFEEMFPVKKEIEDSGYNVSKWILKKGKKLKVKMNLECTYFSDTWFKIDNPIEKEATIIFDKKGNTQIKENNEEWEDIS